MAFLHLTHSDPRNDARVLKQMKAGARLGNMSVFSIGREDLSLNSDFPTPSSLRFILLGSPGGHRNREHETHVVGLGEGFRAPKRSLMSGGTSSHCEDCRRHQATHWFLVTSNYVGPCGATDPSGEVRANSC